MLVAELPSGDERLWELPFWGAIPGVTKQGLKCSEHLSSENQAVCFKPLKMQALFFFEYLGPGNLQSHRPLILLDSYGTVGLCDELHFWCFSLVNSKKKLLF